MLLQGVRNVPRLVPFTRLHFPAQPDPHEYVSKLKMWIYEICAHAGTGLGPVIFSSLYQTYKSSPPTLQFCKKLKKNMTRVLR